MSTLFGRLSLEALPLHEPILVATFIAVALGDTIGIVAGLMLAVIATGVILSTLEPSRADVPAGDFDFVADALDGPAVESTAATTPPAMAEHPVDTRRAALLSIVAALAFGLGLVAAGKSAALVPVAWVALSARLVGIVVVVIPLLMQRRFRLTRVALPLVVIAGTGEVLGSMLSAWGSRDSIAITAVLGSQFAAIAAVAAFILFGERLSRVQVIGVVLIVSGVTLLAAATA